MIPVVSLHDRDLQPIARKQKFFYFPRYNEELYEHDGSGCHTTFTGG